MSSIFSGKLSEISAKNAKKESDGITMLSLDLIDPDEGQPRKTISEEALLQLATSIEKDGVQSPIKVRGGKNGRLGENGRYIIVFGERRYRASKLLDLKEIPVIIDNNFETLKDVRRVQWAENEEREELSEEERSKVIIAMLDDGLTQEEIAKDRNISQARVSQLNSMRDRPAFLLNAWEKGIIDNASVNAEIKAVWKKNKEAVEEWVSEQNEKISVSGVKEFKKLLKMEEKALKQEKSGGRADPEASVLKENEVVEGTDFKDGAELSVTDNVEEVPSLEGDDFSLQEPPKEIFFSKERPGSAFSEDKRENDGEQDDFSFEQSNEDEDGAEEGSLSPSESFEIESEESAAEQVVFSAEKEKIQGRDESDHQGNPEFRVPVSPVEEVSDNEEEVIRNPKLIVEFYGKRALLLLHKKPSSEDKVWIKYHADGIESEVLSEQLTLKSLLEG